MQSQLIEVLAGKASVPGASRQRVGEHPMTLVMF